MLQAETRAAELVGLTEVSMPCLGYKNWLEIRLEIGLFQIVATSNAVKK